MNGPTNTNDEARPAVQLVRQLLGSLRVLQQRKVVGKPLRGPTTAAAAVLENWQDRARLAGEWPVGADPEAVLEEAQVLRGALLEQRVGDFCLTEEGCREVPRPLAPMDGRPALRLGHHHQHHRTRVYRDSAVPAVLLRPDDQSLAPAVHEAIGD